jgi:glycosyltransferase involved in cell wall biosynthesis
MNNNISSLLAKKNGRPTKVLFFATNTNQYNGYSYAIYELACELAKKDDIELTLFGFQNFYKNSNHLRQVPSNVYQYDAYANEDPKQSGFGFEQVTEFATMNEPDVCIIYNDMVVVSNVIDKLYKVPNKNFKIIVYIDQVYLHQKKEYIELLNNKADFILAFTKYWEECAISQGITLPIDYLQHGFNPMTHYPFPKQLARNYYGIKEDDFIILNLNRNQPRKRWDICLQAFAEIVKRHNNKQVKLLIATALQGAWNLMEVFERELKKRNLTLEDGMKHLILIDNPQQLTDEEINILYNLADVGINTCDGEGFGLCNFQQAAIGIPQVVPAIGGFLDFFDKDTASMVDPAIHLYIESSRDGVGGESQLCHYNDFVEALEKYIENPLHEAHGKNARNKILEQYKWSDLGDKLHTIINKVVHPRLLEEAIDEIDEIDASDASKSTNETYNKSEINLDDVMAALAEVNVENLKTIDESSLTHNESSTPPLQESKQKKVLEEVNNTHVSDRAKKLLKARRSSKKNARKSK